MSYQIVEQIIYLEDLIDWTSKYWNETFKGVEEKYLDLWNENDLTFESESELIEEAKKDTFNFFVEEKNLHLILKKEFVKMSDRIKKFK